MSRSRREEVIEEVEWLLSYRTVPEDIAHRLGYSSVVTLERAIRRYGRNDLANQLLEREATDSACRI